MIIKPSTALRNDYNAISKLAHETQEPVYITKNGEGDLVVMSIDAFERERELLKLRMKLSAVDRMRRSGEHGIPLETFRKEMEALYGEEI